MSRFSSAENVGAIIDRPPKISTIFGFPVGKELYFALWRRILLRQNPRATNGRPYGRKIEMEHPIRKKNRLQNYDYSQNGAYFITICTKNRKCCLSTIRGGDMVCHAHAEMTYMGRIVETAILGISRIYRDVHVEKYSIMPNHIHIMLMIDVPPGRPMVAPTVARIIKWMKGYVTKQVGGNLFQKSYHDRIIRNDNEYQMVWQYIDNNPALWEKDCFYTEE